VFSSGGAIWGAKGGGCPLPPDSRFVTYAAPVHQVVNVYEYFAKLRKHCIIIGYSLLCDELAIAQQLVSDILTCFAADVLNTVPLRRHPIGAPYSTII